MRRCAVSAVRSARARRSASAVSGLWSFQARIRAAPASGPASAAVARTTSAVSSSRSASVGTHAGQDQQDPESQLFVVLGAGRDLVDGPPRLVPGVAGGVTRHVPAPGDGWGDTHVYAWADHSVPFDRLIGVAVDPYASGYEWIEGHHVVDDQGNLVVSGPDVAELAGVGNGRAGTPIQKNVPSNSNASGTTSGCPSAERVATRAIGCDCR